MNFVIRCYKAAPLTAKGIKFYDKRPRSSNLFSLRVAHGSRKLSVLKSGDVSITDRESNIKKSSSIDLQTWLSQLPYKRIAAWLFVGFLAHQLKDFFGVYI